MKLTKKIMEAFGFREVWPGGNPTEPWWEHEKYSTFFNMPTASEFIAYIEDKARHEGKESVRKEVRSALGI